MTRLQLTGYINISGYRGLRSWCIDKGYEPNTANAAIHRHLGRVSNPKGKTRQILHELEALTGQQLYTRPTKTIAPGNATPPSPRATKEPTQKSRKTA